MWRLACVFTLAAGVSGAQTTLDGVAKSLGASNLRTIEYSGTGASFNVGQNVNPAKPWPRNEIKSYRRAIDYEKPASREEITRQQGNPAMQFFSAGTAWNQAGNNPAPAPPAAVERNIQLWLTPHGFVKAAQTNRATVKGKTITFMAQGRSFKGTADAQNLLERVETTVPNPVFGEMPVEVAFTEYRDFNGVKFPGKILQKQGGFPSLELTITDVRPNASVSIDAPAPVRDAKPAPVAVKTEKLAEGVWYLTGGSHHSVVVEFKDHVAVIEAPLNEERTRAVLAEAKSLVAGKPVRYLINTHHHFDHSGGVRAALAERIRIVTHKINEPFYKKTFKGGSYLTVSDKRVLTDGNQTIELHHIQGNPHHEGILMAYLPKQKILVEVDVYSPPAPNAPPATPAPAAVNLYENIQRLKLDVAQIAALHGRVVTMKEFEKAIGKAK
jgi:glyoxylase-like metal-dependent hydrolase (beta-lactamase superfamily II)